MKGWRKAEEQGARQADCGEEREDRSVEAVFDIVRSGGIERRRVEEPNGTNRQWKGQHAAEQRQDAALHEQLANDPPAGGAK